MKIYLKVFNFSKTVLSLLFFLVIAALLMELSLTFIVSQPNLEPDQITSVPKPTNKPKPPAEKEKPKQAPCDTNFVAFFKQERQLLCAEIDFPPFSGPPSITMYPDGLEIVNSDLKDNGFCGCLFNQPAYEEHLPIKRVSSLLLSESKLPIEKWVCSDLCQQNEYSREWEPVLSDNTEQFEPSNQNYDEFVKEQQNSNTTNNQVDKPNFKIFTSLQDAFQQQGVSWIYVLFLMSLTLQMVFTWHIWRLPKTERQIFLSKIFPFSEWNINVPPTLGVLGTIIAMSIAISSKEIAGSEDFMQIFMQNFWAAVSTTILGGIIYTLNLKLHAVFELSSNHSQ